MLIVMLVSLHHKTPRTDSPEVTVPGSPVHASLDPQVAELLDAAVRSGAPPLAACTPEQARERVRAGDVLCAPGPAVADVAEVEIPVGPAHLTGRLYRPSGAALGTVVYLHGGGWVTGDLEYSDALCRHLAAGAGCSVLSVDYRLAPEHPYPAPLDDAYGALQWAADDLARDLPLVVGGDSAGGALAAGAALRARDENGPRLAAQLLVYPVLDADLTRRSYAENGQGLILGPDEMAWFWAHYLPDPQARRAAPAAPLRATDLTGLPPTVLVVADLDPLRDEGLAYARGLADAGVPVTLRHVPGLVHGFLRFTARVDAAAALAPAIAGDLRATLTASASVDTRQNHAHDSSS
jgi:acetyl esterase